MAIALVAVAFLDEFGAGVSVVAAPDIRTELELSYGGLALALLFVPAMISLCIETPLLAWSDRRRRDRVLVGALVVLAVASLAAAFATTAWSLAIALGATGTAMGVASGVAQASLVAAHPLGPERAMTRWTIGGAIGDAVAPAVLGLLVLLGGSWRTGFVVVAVLVLVHALVVLRSHAEVAIESPSATEPEVHEPFMRALADALRDRKLMAWLAGTATCGLLDEPLVAFAAVWLREGLAASPVLQAGALVALALGGWIGLLVAEALLSRFAPLIVLAWSCIACIASMLGWLAVDHPIASVAMLTLSGVAIAPLYPIAQAQAYRLRPERPGLVGAAGQLFMPLELAVPLAVGWLADAVGLRWALLVLLVQPVVLLVLAIRPPRGPSLPGEGDQGSSSAGSSIALDVQPTAMCTGLQRDGVPSGIATT